MSEKKVVKPVALAVGAALASSFAITGASADGLDNPFEMSELTVGYMIGGGEGSCGEGSCGGDKGDKKGEGSCGEGSCGGDKEDKKEGEGSCGSEGDKGEEGSCGEKDDAEGACGEGSCGGSL